MITDMNIETTQAVNISLTRYEELLIAENELRKLLEAIYQEVSLSYSKDKLSLNTSDIESYLRIADSQRYWKIYDTLNDALKGKDDGIDND